jgi:hypothetical protein
MLIYLRSQLSPQLSDVSIFGDLVRTGADGEPLYVVLAFLLEDPAFSSSVEYNGAQCRCSLWLDVKTHALNIKSLMALANERNGLVS